MADSKAPTHTAFALKREGKKHGRWLEIGTARQDSTGVIHVFLDRTPIGGFNGYAYLAPTGAQPPLPEQEPQRPDQSEAIDGEEKIYPPASVPRRRACSSNLLAIIQHVTPPPNRGRKLRG